MLFGDECAPPPSPTAQHSPTPDPLTALSATSAAGTRDNVGPSDALPNEHSAAANTVDGGQHSTHPPPKPLYGLTCRTPSHRRLQPKSSSSPQQRPLDSDNTPRSHNWATTATDATSFDTFFREPSSSNTRHHRTTLHPTTSAPTHSPHPITDNLGSSATTCANERIPEHTTSKHMCHSQHLEAGPNTISKHSRGSHSEEPFGTPRDSSKQPSSTR